MADPRLIELLDGLPRTTFDGQAFRHTGPDYHPLATEGSRIRGGRWNPPDSFSVLYLALDPQTTAAELRRLAHRQAMPVASLLPRTLHTLRVSLGIVLDLRPQEVLDTLGIGEAIRGDDMQQTQAIGEAAHYLGIEGLLAPSATSVGDILPVFFDRLAAGSRVEPLSSITWSDLPETQEGRTPEA